MSNLNRVLLMGRLTRDPELRYTPQGTAVSEIGLAMNREYTVGTERRKETTFVEVTLWKRQAEVVCQYLKKGSPIFVEGRLSFDAWETPDGQKRSRLRVIAENFQFLGGRAEGETQPEEPASGSEYSQPGQKKGGPWANAADSPSTRSAAPQSGYSPGYSRVSAPDGAEGDAEAPEPGGPLGLSDSEIPF